MQELGEVIWQRPHELDGIRHRFSALQMDGGPAAFRVQSGWLFTFWLVIKKTTSLLSAAKSCHYCVAEDEAHVILLRRNCCESFAPFFGFL
jgi:hypothetical protein